ncbi:Mitochondrial distribution and morphology protein 31, mitochondrial precursor [Scheffersomyces spartinae]|uniref:Mitochondrial distribution and morphology protein 31, mitochondrial n=1 Tax=Scheffersomyces spartinae TaxID=45513 RepID=A0A9P7V7C1_9ASCO|nr:Mitochondrial distribution and morphology protein 31, mitochondrial precursor [Scheffersomyces spartinae]KAG7192246.1 Mitochondrial distribution and morphology protein 31, mitochondrial precursor [Scheffersomyces spartinae]
MLSQLGIRYLRPSLGLIGKLRSTGFPIKGPLVLTSRSIRFSAQLRDSKQRQPEKPDKPIKEDINEDVKGNKLIQDDSQQTSQENAFKAAIEAFKLDRVHRNRIIRDHLLLTTNNIFSRIRIQWKWLVKKSNNPFNTDDYSAMFSWLMMGNALLIILGTTTFFSMIIFTLNTVFAQEFVAQKLGEFITKNSNLTVTFEEAIVPTWSDGKISFRKCSCSRRPRKIKTFVKKSQAEAIADTEEQVEEFDDGNYTQFDLTIEEVSITLSFRKWLAGTGIIKTMEMRGMRGVVDRTNVHWDPDDDATNYKNIAQPGDFEFDVFKMEDVLFELMQPAGFRPFNVAIYNCELSRLRKHWLFFDFLNADVMNGAYDNALFTIHKKQRLLDFKVGSQLTTKGNPWQRVTRCRVDSLNIDHLNTGLEGPFGWITAGKVDMIGDVMIPKEPDQSINVSEIVTIIAHSIKKEATRYKNPEVKKQQHPDLHMRLTRDDYKDISKYFVLDLTIKLHNVRAMVPFQAPELSYINYALIRPIVAYINSKNTFIEIHSRIVKNMQDFSGSWTIYDSLLMDDISEEVYDSFVDYVADEQERYTRMAKVGFWSVQLLFQLIVIGLGAIS